MAQTCINHRYKISAFYFIYVPTSNKHIDLSDRIFWMSLDRAMLTYDEDDNDG